MKNMFKTANDPNMQNFALIFLLTIVKSCFYLLPINLHNDDKRVVLVNTSPKSFRSETITLMAIVSNASNETRWHDVVINEIFADPSPIIGLPAKEYVELLNTTDNYILLKGWKYGDRTSTFTFGADTLAPHQYLILCATADKADFLTYGKVKGIAPWPSLNNDRDQLFLINESGQEIDAIAYDISWYKDAMKKSGGYSLERIDPENICTGIQNWRASNDGAGGTPGKVNSVYQSQLGSTKPQLIQFSVVDSVTILLEFNKYVDSTSAANTAHYQLNNGLGNPLIALPVSPEFTLVQLTLKSPIIRGRKSTLLVSGVTDCAGNVLEEKEIPVFLPDLITEGDVRISEILFNPRMDGVDFVEVYNASNKVFDLRTLEIHNSESGSSFAVAGKLPNPMYIQPDNYYVFTSDPLRVQAQYETRTQDNFIKLSLPAFKISSGMVILKAAKTQIDRLDYNEAMHSPIFRDVKGVSLERVSFSENANTGGNFTSASATAGYATPGYRNSMATQQTDGAKRLSLTEKVFSPDNDGSNDLLEIKYHSRDAGKMGNLTIYDDRGNLVRKLMRNHNLATAGNLFWDGLSDAGNRCKIGIYILKMEVFDLSGKTEKFYVSCVLAEKL